MLISLHTKFVFQTISIEHQVSIISKTSSYFGQIIKQNDFHLNLIFNKQYDKMIFRSIRLQKRKIYEKLLIYFRDFFSISIFFIKQTIFRFKSNSTAIMKLNIIRKYYILILYIENFWENFSVFLKISNLLYIKKLFSICLNSNNYQSWIYIVIYLISYSWIFVYFMFHYTKKSLVRKILLVIWIHHKSFQLCKLKKKASLL